jgi:hypothetical protein
MSILNELADTLSVNNFVLIVGLVIILAMVSFVAVNNSHIGKTVSNIITLALFTLIFTAVIVYPPFMKSKFVGQPSFTCEVFERHDSGDVIFEFEPILDADGNPKLDTQGNPLTQSFPKLKKYYFPLQDVELIQGVLNIRLQSANESGQTVERYCAFDIFPKSKDKNSQEQSAEQIAMKKWYNKLKGAKEALDRANAVKNLSEMSEEEISSVAKGMSEDPQKSIKQIVKGDTNLNRLKAELGKQMAQRQAEQQNGESPKTSKGLKPGKGLIITLPAEGKKESSENNVRGEGPHSDPHPNWEVGNAPDPSGQSNRDPLPPKTQ